MVGFKTLFAAVAALGFVAAAPVEDMQKRDSHTGQATFFETGLGACGNWNVNSDYIVALPDSLYEGGNKCGQQLLITNTDNGKTATASVADLCPSCVQTGGDGSIDLTPSLFAELADGNMDLGIVPVSWYFL